MRVELGVDTLCYHMRLVDREITLDEVVREVADLGGRYVQLNAIHVRDYTADDLDRLRATAGERGVSFTLSGDVVGRASRGDTVQEGAARVKTWLELADRLDSPFARVSSGFYRQELAGSPELIRDEQRYIVDSLRIAAAENTSGRRILLENHSDFTPDEYIEIITTVGPDQVGVFLDVINPISVMADPIPTVAALFPWAPAGHVKDYRMASHYVEDGFHRRGFDIQWCYPGEGVADLPALLGVIAQSPREGVYQLAIEGLDNRAGLPDQRERLGPALEPVRGIVGG